MKQIFMTIFVFGVFAGAPALAFNDGWEEYVSSTGIYEAQVPEEHKVSQSFLLVGKNRAIVREENQSIFDYRHLNNTQKTYIIKVDQSLGPSLNEREREALLDAEMAAYESHYRSLGGVVLNRETKPSTERHTGFLTIQYDDPTFGEQFLQAKIIFSDITKLEQIAIANEKVIESVRTEEFFNRLELEGGQTGVDEDIATHWQETRSPLGIFTTYIPYDTKPFHTKKPIIDSTSHSEVIRTVYEDPVRGQSLFYNIYSYRVGGTLDFDTAEKVLLSRHISKQRKRYADVRFGKDIVDDVPTINTRYNINAPRGYPYVDTVQLRAVFAGGVITVQEIIGPGILVNSDFANYLMTTMIFHPAESSQSAFTQ
jgi:hypothetical protein